MELAGLISTPPQLSVDSSERLYDINAAIDQLAIRGFETENLIRYGIGRLPVIFAAPILFEILREDEGFKAAIDSRAAIDSNIRLDEIPSPNQGWTTFFHASFEADAKPSTDSGSVAYYALHGFIDRIKDWLEIASLADIVAWNPPSHCQVRVAVPALEADSSVGEMRELAVWMLDRFTVTDLADWSTSSLRLEWRYLHGRVTAPCSSTSMAERKVAAEEVARAIAEEVSVTNEAEITPAHRLIPVALEHLQNGKPELAAGIFDAMVKIYPGDPDARNNLGFCLLPIDPHAALPELELAEKLSGGTLLTLANRVLALHLIGRNTEAIAIATSERVADLPSGDAAMWAIERDHQLALRNVDSLRSYLNSLVTHIKEEIS